jgi:GAF domain-containing protein
LVAVLRAAGIGALSRHCRTAIGTVSGVGLTVFPATAARFVVSTDGLLIDLIENLQICLGQGPGLEAVQTGQPVLVEDLAVAAATVRWPAFTGQARRHGVAAVFTFPVFVSGRALAVLDLCRASPGPLSEGDRDQAARYAGAAAVLLTEEGRGRAAVAVAGRQ